MIPKTQTALDAIDGDDRAVQAREGLEQAAATVRAEVDAALGRVAGQVKDARRIGLLNVLASCITLAAAAVALWVALR